MCVVDFECDILVNRSLTFAQDSAPTTTDHAPCSGGLVRQPPHGSSEIHEHSPYSSLER